MLKQIIIFLALRLLVVISTVISINAYGTSVEANPIMTRVIYSGIVNLYTYQIMLTAIVVLIFSLLKGKKMAVTILTIFNVIVGIVVFSNFFFFILSQRVPW